MTTPVARARLVLVAALLGVAAWGTAGWLAADLPATIAMHFDGSGAPDGSGPAGMIGLLVLAPPLAALVGGLVVLQRHPDRRTAPPAIALATWLATFMTAIGVDIARVNDGVATWTDAGGLDARTAVVVFVLPVVVATGVTVALRRLLPSPPRTPRGPLPSVGLVAGERATWSEDVTLPWAAGLGLLLAAVGAVLAALGGDGVAGILLLLSGLLVGLLGHRFRVTVGAEGVRVHFGLLGWPRLHVPLDEVVAARVEDIEPLQWGGWGYRGSLKALGKVAVVHRRGPGLVLELTDDRQVVVTCDDAGTAAGLCNDLRARLTPPV